MAALELFKKNSSFLTQYPSVHGYMKTQTLDQSCLMLGPLIQRGVNADLYVGMYQRSRRDLEGSYGTNHVANVGDLF